MAETLKCKLRQVSGTIGRWAGVAAARVRRQPRWFLGGGIGAGLLLLLLALQTGSDSQSGEPLEPDFELETIGAADASVAVRDDSPEAAVQTEAGDRTSAASHASFNSWSRRTRVGTEALGETAADWGGVRHAAAWLERSDSRSTGRAETVRPASFESAPRTHADGPESPRGAWLAGYIEPLPDDDSRR